MRGLSLALWVWFVALEVHAAPSAPEMVASLRTIDDRMRSPGDYTATVYIEQKRKGEMDRILEVKVLRRDSDDALIILTQKPKTEAGQGSLRVDKNLWFYNPSVGKWERRTERDRVQGTDARRRDFDDWDLANEYDPTYVADEKLGAFAAQKLKLTAKAGVDVAFPILHLWIDTASGNPLKIERLAASGRLMQTTYYPKWVSTAKNAAGKAVLYPQEIRIFDEVEKGNQTIMVVRSADATPLPANIFTKAWLESQSR
jgi:outer membrane lipoprotein-sorting protein